MRLKPFSVFNFFLQTILFSFVLVGCSNILDESAKTKTPAAIYYEAKDLMGNGNYDAAINLLQSLGPTYLSQRDVALVYASAFSGRCGLNLVNLIQQLENVGTSPTIFLFFMGLYPGGTDAKIGDCVFSESTVNTFGNYTQRTADENILMGLSSITKVGTILSRYADADNDGAADAGFDHCDLTDFPDDAVREIGTGIANAILSISAVSSTISSGALTDITAICALNVNLNSFCTTTDKNSFSATEVTFLRSVLASTSEGIGAPTCPGSFITCICP
ncbi:hypothetical protein K2X05_09495 [bacterium]|nr:hypothetical protein [bacterium]